jgi:hypothetical protein
LPGPIRAPDSKMILSLILGMNVRLRDQSAVSRIPHIVALATVVGILVEVPVMLSVVWIVLRTCSWYQAA